MVPIELLISRIDI